MYEDRHTPAQFLEMLTEAIQSFENGAKFVSVVEELEQGYSLTHEAAWQITSAAYRFQRRY